VTVPTEAAVAEISLITQADMSDAMVLVAEAGWNQIEADWRYMLANGRGYGIRDGGKLIASSMILSYPPRIGWIGMVLVAGSHRKRGYATRLLRNAIDLITAAGLTPMLDATPAGREVYRRLGFSDGEPIERWRGSGKGNGGHSNVVDLNAAAERDSRAFGADRRPLLAELASRPDAPCFTRDGAVLLGRRGRTATQLGPLLSDADDAAAAACAAAIAALSGPLLIDVPVREAALHDLLQANGFAVERPFMRMALNGPATIGNSMGAIAGPELG
jgi:GNAT superfamily N-acetyltransferase